MGVRVAGGHGQDSIALHRCCCYWSCARGLRRSATPPP